eukprot:TRINITY_DN94648_c0_g1_i1.p1 TRINITY_DN94648_c0_g1~~TRINITY_DN94648_c0_g1_i1.p1  ORF type:complete len:357 (-),score=61.72 TRINITY_DN94648_c0_g1_i1:130-1119(-)
MSQFQTLWALVQGLLYCVPILAWTFLLVMILIYLFAVMGMEFIQVDPDLPQDHPYNVAVQENFSDLGDAIMILLQCFSLDSIAGVYRPLVKHRVILFFYFMSVILLLSIALMNLVTAIMVDSSMDQANADKDTIKALESARKARQMEQLKEMFIELDEDGSGELTLDEIDSAPPEAVEQLMEIAGTDDIKALFDLLDYDGGGTVGTDEFCEGVMKATNSEKPMELSKLVKQCGEILQNYRETHRLVCPDGIDGEGDDEGDTKEETKPEPIKIRPHEADVERLKLRVRVCEDMVENITTQVSQVLSTLESRFRKMDGGEQSPSNRRSPKG